MALSPGDTRPALIVAAAEAFNRVGYEATNTNRIARDAGFAPQTFYRHFADKLAVFIAVYDSWAADEIAVIDTAATADDLVRLTVAHHEANRLFRRTLRDLAVRQPAVAAARAASRRRQIDAIARRSPAFAARPWPAQIGTLLTFERLCDALVEGEFDQLGATRAQAAELLTAMADALGLG